MVCTAAAQCGSSIVFEDVAPEQATIAYETAGGSTEDVFSPASDLSRPTGPDCPPLCPQTTVVLQIGP